MSPYREQLHAKTHIQNSFNESVKNFFLGSLHCIYPEMPVIKPQLSCNLLSKELLSKKEQDWKWSISFLLEYSYFPVAELFVLNLATVVTLWASMNKITWERPCAFFYQKGTSRLFLFHQRQLPNPLAIDFPAKFFQYTLSSNPLLFVLPKDQQPGSNKAFFLNTLHCSAGDLERIAVELMSH